MFLHACSLCFSKTHHWEDEPVRNLFTAEQLGYGPDDLGIGVEFSAGECNFFYLLRSVQIGCGAHRVSCLMGNVGSSPGSKALIADLRLVPRLRMRGAFPPLPIILHGMVVN